MAYHNITDGEKVNYRYDLGGNLKNLVGANSYIENIVYDHYEQRTGVFFGNGIHSTFSYSPTNRRLQEHRLEHPNNGNGLLKNNYSFDFVGNITNILNYAVQSPNEMGGAYNFNYGYDQLNRLIAASGEFGVDKNTSTYQNTPYAVSNSEFALEMGYTPSGGIDFKNQNHLQNQQTNPQNTYANRYHYIGGTHKLATIENQSAGTTEEFKYDENGNVIMHWNPTDGEKNMFWDEQDRMKAFYSNETGTFQYYTYDDKGERIIKYNLKEGAKLYQNGALVDGYMEMIGYKLYPNAYWTLSSDGTRTKHYFAGDQRVASRVLVEAPFMKQSASKTTDTREETTIPNPEEDLKVYLRKAGLADGKIAAEFSKAASTISGLYYLHGDHLGTATYVTDSNGETTQFFLNLPFGETMAEQNLPGAYENPYKFNAKELDVETGLYYYGARYFNPRISLWYGVDALAIYNPVMEDEFYGDGQHNGGVFFWGNLNPYIYTYQNPIAYIDPNGKQTYFNSKVDGSGNRFFESAGQGSNPKFSHLTVVNVYDSRNKYVRESIVATDAAGQTVSKYGKHYRQAPNDPNSGWDYTKQVAKIAWESDEVRPILLAPIEVLTVAKLESYISKLTSITGNWGKISGLLQEAARKQGNFGMGSATYEEAMVLGRSWVGDGYRIASDGKSLVSADGLKVFRSPTFKKNLGKVQANFEWKEVKGGANVGNGHLDIKNIRLR